MSVAAKYRKPQHTNNFSATLTQPVETGHYVTKDQRQTVALEVKKSHFILGNDQDDFRSKDQIENMGQNWNINSKSFQAPLHSSKNSNVQIGFNNKFLMETSQKNDYTFKSPQNEKKSLALEAKQELRKSHFHLGSDLPGPDTYTTTNMEKQSKSDLPEIANLRGKPKYGTNIVYGRDHPTYQSTMKDTNIRHSLQASLLNKQLLQEQGQNVKKHNFQLGYNDDKVSVDLEYTKLAMDVQRARSNMLQTNPASHVNSKRSNVYIGGRQSSNDYYSVSKMAQLGLQSMNNQSQRNEALNTAQLALKTQLELRKTHFQIGRDSKSVIETSSMSMLKNIDNAPLSSSIVDKDRIQGKMTKKNFVIGDIKNRSMKFAETSYRQAVTAETTKQPAQDNKMHLNVSVSLGNHQAAFVSETKQMFDEKTSTRDTQIQQMIDRNRNPNFKFGDLTNVYDPKAMTSVMKSQFDYKGNQGRQMIDPATIKEMRQHNFQMGSHPSEYGTSALKPAIVTTEKRDFRKDGKPLLGHSGAKLFGQDSPSEALQANKASQQFKTTNQIYSKWIQPAPSKTGIAAS